MINEENNIVKNDKQYNNFSEENISKEADETVEQNIKALEDSLKNKTNEENNFSKNQNTENTGDAFEQIDNKKAELLNKIKTDSEKSIQGKGDVVLHDDELKPLNKKKRVLKNNSEHTYITGIGVIDDNNIFLSKAHLKKICSFLGLSIVLFFLLSYIVPVIIKFILDFSSFNGTGVYSSIITNQTGYQIITIILYLISLCVPYLIYRAFIKIPFSVAISRRKTPKGSFLKLIFTAMMFAAVANVLGGIFSTILSQIFGDGIMASSLNVPTDITAFILFFISTAVLPAIIEEGIFRGIVLQSLRPHGDGLAIILSSAI
ncbi:MAG: lysostaphin resistance A-like protein, partial [Oscillospiraceae bacterium]